MGDGAKEITKAGEEVFDIGWHQVDVLASHISELGDKDECSEKREQNSLSGTHV